MRPSLGISATIRLRLQLKQSLRCWSHNGREQADTHLQMRLQLVLFLVSTFFYGLYFHLTPPPISLSQRWLSPQPLFRSRTADKAKLVSLFQASYTLWVMCRVLCFCLTLQKSWQSHLKVLCTHFPFFHAVILSFPACALDWTEIFRMWEVWNGVICVCLRPPLAARRGNIERRKCWLRGRKVSD